ncbi:MAG: carboxymuconolactone decarboxylase family protein [Candidatus Korobacteraceae bacterium]
MARLSYVEMDQASPEVREVYEKTLRGNPGSVQKLIAHRPEVLKNFLPFYASVGRSLERRLYEMVYIRVSMINSCHYCLQHHLAGSKRVGLTAQDWQGLKQGELAGFSPKEQAALRFAEKLTRDPHSVGDHDIDSLRPHFSEAEIVDLDLLIGLANLTNRFTDPLGADLEFAEEKI